MIVSQEKINFLCKTHNTTIATLEKDLNFSNGYINQERTRQFPGDKLALIADYFGVDLLSLLNDDSPIIYLHSEADDDLPEEVQMIKESSGIRSLLQACKGLSEDQLTLIAKLVSQIRR